MELQPIRATVCRAMMRASIVLALVVSSLGCQRDPSACRIAAEDLNHFLHTMDLERGPVGLRKVELPLRDDLEDRTGTGAAAVYVTASRVLVSSPHEFFLNDRDESCDDLLDACFDRLRKRSETALLDGLAAKRNALGLGPDPRKLYFVIDRAVRWDRIVAVAAAAHHAGFDLASFLFARTPSAPPPPRTWVDREYEQFDSQTLDGRNAELLARLARKILTCESFKEGFHANGDMPPSTYMIMRAPEQVLECNCDLDMPALRSLMWQLLGTPRPVTLLDLTLAPSGTPLELPAAMLWQEASARLAARPPTWFRVATQAP